MSDFTLAGGVNMSHFNHNHNRFSLQYKVILAVAGVYFLTLIVVTLISISDRRANLLRYVEDNVEETANNYFDSLNVLMLSGGIANRVILEEKLRARLGVEEVRTVRSDAVNQMFKTPGLDTPKDDWDRRALGGEQQAHLKEGASGRHLTVLIPMKSSANTRGTNCTTCHTDTDGRVLGAVRVTYSLAAYDAAFARENWMTVGLSVVMLGVGIVMVGWLLRRIILTPIRHLQDKLLIIERDADFSERIDIVSNDELGVTATVINHLLVKFHDILRNMAETTVQLSSQANMMSSHAEETNQRVSRQQAELEQLATAINEMSSTVQEVAHSTASAADATQQANEQANQGHEVVEETIAAISTLAKEVKGAATVIHQLQQESASIGTVLDVIRGIADQTNLLALNAAIEAARAGEQGRGFAVVADEVRTLASRTQQSTREIQELIQRLQSGASQAVTAMEQGSRTAEVGMDQAARAGTALEEIRRAVATLNDLNIQIATATEEQSAVAEEINRNVSNISTFAHDTALQTESSSREMYSFSESLRQLTAQYTTNERNRFDFNAAKAAHLAWKTRLRSFLNGTGPLTREQAVSHHHCQLGKWYYSEGLSKYGHIPEMRQIESPHAELHNIIKNILRLKEAGDTRGAEAEFSKVEAISKQIVGLLDKVEKKMEG
ncbi:methyl-accepting chemotaxis protein [Gammaproteobacteria bacterium]